MNYNSHEHRKMSGEDVEIMNNAELRECIDKFLNNAKEGTHLRFIDDMLKHAQVRCFASDDCECDLCRSWNVLEELLNEYGFIIEEQSDIYESWGYDC